MPFTVPTCWNICILIKPGSALAKSIAFSSKNEGVVRIAVPDLDRIVANYDPLQPEEFLEKMFEASQKRAKNQHHWHYNEIALARLLTDAGFRKVWRCGFKQGQCPDVALIDNRPESLFMEGLR